MYGETEKSKATPLETIPDGLKPYKDAFRYINALVEENNPKLFHAAEIGYKKVGQRGALMMLYTQVSDVYDAAGMAAISYRPKDIILTEDGEEVADMCDEYDPEKQFVLSVAIGQENDPEKPVLRNTQIVDYIGIEEERRQKAMTMTLGELHGRLEGEKTYRCDWCAQKWRVDKLRRDPFIGKLVFCPDKDDCWKEGLKQNYHLIEWYKEKISGFNVEGLSKEDVKTHLPQIDISQEGNTKKFDTTKTIQ